LDDRSLEMRLVNESGANFKDRRANWSYVLHYYILRMVSTLSNPHPPTHRALPIPTDMVTLAARHQPAVTLLLTRRHRRPPRSYSLGIPFPIDHPQKWSYERRQLPDAKLQPPSSPLHVPSTLYLFSFCFVILLTSH